jgi:hypothetical protein
MSALELVVLIGITAVFTIFGAVLAWASWGDGKSAAAPRAMPARAPVRNRPENRVGEDRVDQIGRAASA